MENMGYSYGCIQTVVALLRSSREALDDMIVWIEDEQPDEQAVIAKLADYLPWHQNFLD